MKMRLLSITCTVLLLGCSSDDDKKAYTEQVVVPGYQPPLYQDTSKVATVLSKKSLKNNREQYHVRLADGREIDFIIDSPIPFQTGDLIILPS